MIRCKKSLLLAAVLAFTSTSATAQNTEIVRFQTIESAGGFGTSIGETSAGYLAISHADTDSEKLHLWIDDGSGAGKAGDGVANGAENRDIDNLDSIGALTSLGLNNTGKLAVSYYDQFNSDLKLWVDDGAGMGVAGDGQANGAELRTIDSTGDVGSSMSLGLTVDGRLAIAYFSTTDSLLKLWVDDGAGMGIAGDEQANGAEIRVIDSGSFAGIRPSIGLSIGGNLAVSYLDGSNADLKLWVDDGAGMGTAGDAQANGAEVRTIASSGFVGDYSSLELTSDGNLAISYLVTLRWLPALKPVIRRGRILPRSLMKRVSIFGSL